MKRVLWGMTAVLLIALAVLLTNHISNEVMIDKYSHHHYEENIFSFLGFLEPYIAPYNQGNLYYQREEYDSAIEKYQQALKYNPPEGYDCMIRINEVLSMLATFDADAVTVDTYDESIAYLHSAQEILCEKGCATWEGEPGHNADAQKLKEDIDQVIFELGVKVSFIKNDENGDPLSGASLQILDENDQILHEWISNGEPFTEIRFLVGHSYIYHEEKAPEGYTEAEDIEFYINEDGTVSYNGCEEATPADSDVSENQVIMVDQKPEDQSGGGGGEGQSQQGQGGQDPQGGEGEQQEGEGDNSVQQQLQDLQNEGQAARVDEMTEDEYMLYYNFSNGATW